MTTEQDVRNAVAFALGHPGPFVEIVVDEHDYGITVWLLADEVGDRLPLVEAILTPLRPRGVTLTIALADDGGLLAGLAAAS